MQSALTQSPALNQALENVSENPTAEDKQHQGDASDVVPSHTTQTLEQLQIQGEQSNPLRTHTTQAIELINPTAEENVSGILNPTGESSNVLPYLQQIQGFTPQNLSGDLNPTVQSSNVLPNVTLPEHEVNVSRFQGLVNTAGCADHIVVSNAPSSCNNLLDCLSPNYVPSTNQQYYPLTSSMGLHNEDAEEMFGSWGDTIWPSNVPFLPGSSITPQNAIAAIPPIQNFDRPRPNIFRYGSSSSSSQLVNIDRPPPNILRYGSSSSSSQLWNEQENTLVMPEPISLNEQNAVDVQIFDFRLCVRRGLEGSELHDELLTAFVSQISDIVGCSSQVEHTTRDIFGMLRGCRARPAADEPPRQRRRLVGSAASPVDLALAAAPEDLAPVAGAAEGAGDGQQPGGPPVVFEDPDDLRPVAHFRSIYGSWKKLRLRITTTITDPLKYSTCLLFFAIVMAIGLLYNRASNMLK